MEIEEQENHPLEEEIKDEYELNLDDNEEDSREGQLIFQPNPINQRPRTSNSRRLELEREQIDFQRLLSHNDEAIEFLIRERLLIAPPVVIC
jgi:hypothetical protein